ncbi:MAG: hypothetical protein RL722_2965 [Pseudomonadota bacterium]|jgi:mono/diheme cytochrome c family protein
MTARDHAAAAGLPTPRTPSSTGRRIALLGLVLAALLLASPWLLLWLYPVVALEIPGQAATSAARPAPADAAQLERGRVLALAGNCAGCHTARGGAPYAGGRPIDTPFGRVHAGNLTPDPETGLGRWNADTFWRALHHGQGADGRRLIPAFPYTEFTHISRADADALHAWLQTLAPVRRAVEPAALRWPFGSQPALAAWRLLHFRPGGAEAEAGQSAEWQRGAYLVRGPGHCAACHASRNLLGGHGDDWAGGPLPDGSAWIAPALDRPGQAGVADWPVEDIVALLATGVAPHGRANGPMAEIVARSTQHLPAADLRAMAVYLKSIPVRPPGWDDERFLAGSEPAQPGDPRLAQGAELYKTHCADCHGRTGEGGRTAAGELVVPSLAGNRLLDQEPAANLVLSVTRGGFGAVTAARPRPYGMPPYAHLLDDAELAALLTWLRVSWGHQASALSSAEVGQWRGSR